MRLLNQHRRLIADALVARKFGPLEKVERDRQIDLAGRIYRSQISVDVESAADVVQQLAPGITYRTSSVSVYTNEAHRGMRLPLGFDRAAPWGNMDCKPDIGEPFYDEITGVIGRHFELQNERSEAQNAANAALYKFHTFEKLEEAWPDVMPIVRETCANLSPPPANLPAIATANLNALFDLPVDEQTPCGELVDA